MGAPGWPEFAFCTASTARNRMVFMHSWSRSGSAIIHPQICWRGQAAGQFSVVGGDKPRGCFPRPFRYTNGPRKFRPAPMKPTPLPPTLAKSNPIEASCKSLRKNHIKQLNGYEPRISSGWMTTMLMRVAQIKCYNCGRTCGEVVGPSIRDLTLENARVPEYIGESGRPDGIPSMSAVWGIGVRG